MICLPSPAGRRIMDTRQLLDILARAQDTHYVVLAEFKPDSVPALAPLLFHEREGRVQVVSRKVNGVPTPTSRDIVNLIEMHEWAGARRQVLFYMNGNFDESDARIFANTISAYLMSAYVYEPINPTC